MAEQLDTLGRGDCCGWFSGNYDPGRSVSVSGTVTAMQWVNPQGVVFVKGTDGNAWGFTMDPPNSMLRAGMNKNSLKVGDQVLVDGYLATGTGENCPAALPNSCSAFVNGALHASASTITGDDGRAIFVRSGAEELERKRLLEQQRKLELEQQGR